MVRIANAPYALGLYIGLFLAYFVTGYLLSSISFQSQIVPIWIPAGIALVGCYIWWWRFIPAVFIASFLFNVFTQDSNDIGALLAEQGLGLGLIAFGASLQAFVGSALLRYWIGHPLKQSSNIKILYFILIVGILVNLISSSIGAFSLTLFNPAYSEKNILNNMLYWWLGDSLGVLLATPFLLSLISIDDLDKQQKRSRLLVLSSSSVLFLSVLVLTRFFIDFSDDNAKRSTAREIKSIENGLYRELNNSMAQLQSLASYIQNSKTLSRDNFNTFVEELVDTQLTIAAMSWNPVIAQQDKAEHQLQLRNIYGRDVVIRGEMLVEDDPIVYVRLISPEEKNRKAIGFNVFSNKDRKQSLIDAELSFQSRATPIIQLVQSEKNSPAYLMFFPVFKENKELKGYATGVFLAEDMLKNALDSTGVKRFDYEIYEAGSKEAFSSNIEGNILFNNDDSESLSFYLAGQVWNLFLVVNKEFMLQQQSQSYLLLYTLEFVIVAFITLLMLMMNSRQIQLNRIVAEKTESLKYAVQEANDANSAKSRFLANMSHEIRTPMNAVIGFSTLARHTDDIDAIHDYLEKIEVSSDLLLNIVNDILDISKVEADKLSLSYEDFDMNESCKRINSLFHSQAEEKGLSWIIINNIPSSLYFKGDQVRFEQVLINLCSNALKFTQQGGISLSIDVDVLNSDENQVTVRVKDTGIGISKKNQLKLFSAFTQADDSTSRQFGGTGLGLALSKELSLLMQGDITIESDDGAGAEFIFNSMIHTSKDYCLSGSASNETVEEKSSEGLRNPFSSERNPLTVENKQRDIKKLRILVAEDNEINQLVIAAILERMGIAAVIVINGKEAVQRIQQETFDVILMDCQMPILDGYQATEQIRKLEGFKDLPIFALTADVTAESKRKAKRSGFSGHLSKPILVGDLLEKLESI
jgi:signal transduction histidine kinase/integral membrane sensor domain MASE1